MIQASYEGVLQQSIDSTTGAKTFLVSPALTNADGVLKVGIDQDNEEWFEVTGVNTGNSTITTGTRGLSLTTTNPLTEVSGNRKSHFAGEKIAIVTFPNTIHTQNTDTGTTSTTFIINSGGNKTTLSTASNTGNRVLTLPDTTGELADKVWVNANYGSGVAGVASIIGGTGISASSPTGTVTLTNTGVTSFNTKSSAVTVSTAANGGVAITNTSGSAFTLSMVPDGKIDMLLSSTYGLWIEDTSLATGARYPLIVRVNDSGALNARTNSAVGAFYQNRTNNRTSTTIADSDNTLFVSRRYEQTGAGGTLTITEPVLSLNNNSIQTAGTVNDSADCLYINQDSTINTGYPLNIKQDAVTSTNFKKMVKLGTVTLWISDGTTPNTNLSGTAGDVCFGADSSKSYYCTGTTNWTAF